MSPHVCCKIKRLGNESRTDSEAKKQSTERWLTKFLTHRPSPTWNCSSQEKLLPNWSNELMAKTLNKSTLTSLDFSINPLCNHLINQLLYQLTFLPITHVSASEGKNEVANFSFLFVQRFKFCLPKQHFWWWCHSSGDQESTKVQSDYKEQNES